MKTEQRQTLKEMLKESPDLQKESAEEIKTLAEAGKSGNIKEAIVSFVVLIRSSFASQAMSFT